MSGTSMDGISAGLVSFENATPILHTSHCQPYAESFRNDLLELVSPDWCGSLTELLRLDHLVGQAFADATLQLLTKTTVPRSSIKAIGSHGQTVWHQPKDAAPNSLQIGDPNIIAEATRLTVVADFRRRDMAAGGQGAPLAPAFHADIFRGDEDCAVLNLGGIANLTLLPADPARPVIGFDTGPANLLMDAWSQRYLQKPYDRNGEWARSGTVINNLLDQMLADPFFATPPPKSTGREYFNLIWFSRFLSGEPTDPENIQCTLAELTARSVSEALLETARQSKTLYVCGGGVHNLYLMQRLADLLPGIHVFSTKEKGVDPDFVEAIAFAWLAKKTLDGEAGNLPTVTGAASERVLGAIYHS
ncbi:MAG TPA: anhydro-N-acetylmuramic acid kinase [Chromatiales bacterium]|nr:anhydro-N-acetylmuramic acid kinase [Thiotrichales bacterium]HIP68955.1 anhydro-N-acetylmuramic acid kinase [Chromatiales bacterium]